MVCLLYLTSTEKRYEPFFHIYNISGSSFRLMLQMQLPNKQISPAVRTVHTRRIHLPDNKGRLPFSALQAALYGGFKHKIYNVVKRYIKQTSTCAVSGLVALYDFLLTFTESIFWASFFNNSNNNSSSAVLQITYLPRHKHNCARVYLGEIHNYEVSALNHKDKEALSFVSACIGLFSKNILRSWLPNTQSHQNPYM